MENKYWQRNLNFKKEAFFKNKIPIFFPNLEPVNIILFVRLHYFLVGDPILKKGQFLSNFMIVALNY